jgi:CRP-like cAMP-binding protein
MEVQRWGNQLVLGRQGQHQAQCHLIVYGTVEAVTMTSTGDSRVLLLFGPGDLIGDSLLLGEGYQNRRCGDNRAAANQTRFERSTGRCCRPRERVGCPAPPRPRSRDRRIAWVNSFHATNGRRDRPPAARPATARGGGQESLRKQLPAMENASA